MHYGGNFDPALASQQAKFSKYYSEDGSYEVILDRTTGKEKHLMCIGGTPYESDIVLLKDFAEATAKFVFLHKDYLGTILAITSDTGVVLEQRHFDAWGILTHGEIKLLDRGYTSHEHLQDVGIIHMNGRLYDPLMRRFLNADENIQDPYNTQCYNKYGYVINNPLLFNDPSGEFFPLLFITAAVMKAIIIGAAVGLASYTLGLAVTGNMWRFSAGGALKSMFFGAVSGAVTFGIGELFTVTKAGVQTATSLAKALGTTVDAAGKFTLSTGAVFVGAACHAVAQGALSMMQGGKFLSGAAAGFLGHLGGAAWSNTVGNSDVGAIAFGALSGGVGAELTGGNFWTGAVTGGIVSGLNHAMHKMGDESMFDDDEQQQQGKEVTRKSLGIKNGDTRETMISKVLKNMKVGDYITGDEASFLGDESKSYIKTVTRTSGSTFSVNGKSNWGISIFKSGATISINQTNTSYKITIKGLTGLAQKVNIPVTSYIEGNKTYLVENNQWFSVSK